MPDWGCPYCGKWLRLIGARPKADRSFLCFHCLKSVKPVELTSVNRVTGHGIPVFDRGVFIG